MTINILSILLFIIFLSLGIIHFYWFFGGEWGIKSTIPTKKENENIAFKPNSFVILIVGLTLILSSCFYLFQTGFLIFNLPKWANYFSWILPSFFLMRAIGDFKYVGFFKSIKNTLFAKWDSKLFSPLCLSISIIGFLIVFLH